MSTEFNSENEKRTQPDFRKDQLEDGTSEDRPKSSRSWCRRLFCVLAGTSALVLVLTTVLLVMFIPLSHADMPVQARWLNLTGFPPMPTGVATVVGMKSVKDISGCVSQEALWSCEVPPAQAGLSTTRPDQPNFRFLIRFRNDTLSNETLLEPTRSAPIKRNSGRAANAGALVRRNVWSSYLYTSSPPPPSTEDQKFLGWTSDNVSLPYNGEKTPFYISLLDPIPLQPVKRSNLWKRHFRWPYPTPSRSGPNGTSSGELNSDFPNPSAPNRPVETIPRPAQQGNGEPIAPELYPFAYSQPLRLFNRGQRDEHYGFYTYFDRSIYISTSSGSSNLNISGNTDGVTSNVRLSNASVVCAWSQSRFLVQIWTLQPDVTTLVTPANISSIHAVNSSANDMKGPGSFPYTVTVTLDRHGGDESKKGVYCYELDEQHRVVKGSGTWIAENRAFGGEIVNPAKTPTDDSTGSTKRQDIMGHGIDGGTGGCACQWQN